MRDMEAANAPASGSSEASADEDLVVRTAEGNDLDAVLAIGHRTWPVIYEPIAGLDYVAMGLAKWWTVDVVAASIRQGRTLVADLDGEVVGMAAFGTLEDSLVLWKLYVLPEYHGRGIGSRLMDAVVDRALEAGRERITLSYPDGNAYAARFHHAHGFVETHRESSGSGLPESIWVARDLTEADVAHRDAAADGGDAP